MIDTASISKEPSGWLFALPWDPRHPGGVDHVVLNLFREMLRGGNFTPRMFVASWEHPELLESTDDGRPTARLRVRAPAGTGATMPLAGWLAALPRSLRVLAGFLRANRVRVVNVHFPGLWALQFGLVRRWLVRDGCLILSFHGLDIMAAAQSSGWSRWWWRRLLRSADALVACSEDLAERVRAFDPGIGGKTFAIHNGLDIVAFLDEEDRQGGLDSRLVGRRFILSVAAFEPKKGLDILIRAFARLVSSGDRDTLLVLIGVDRGLRAELLLLAEELDVGELVLTYVDCPHAQLHRYYRAATLFCLPSRIEPFGLVLLEAAAFALPVVASNVGGIPEVIVDGESGRLVPAEDPGALARVLAHMLEQPGERVRLGSALRERVRARFTWAAAYDRYLALARREAERPPDGTNARRAVN